MVILRTFNKIIGLIPGVKCPNCGQITIFKKIKNISRVLILFIPIFQVTNGAYVQCQDCEATYQVNKKALNNINDATELIKEVYDFHNKRQAKKKKK